MNVYIIFAIIAILILLRLNHDYEGFATRSGFDGQIYDVLEEPDNEKAADQLARISLINTRLIDFINFNYKDGRRGRIAKSLKTRYAGLLTENNPRSKKNTSYTEDKGEKIALCLRTRPDRRIHEFNDVLFVNLHELAHVGCEEYGHGDEFWETFVFLQHAAIKAGLYTPVDYSKTPVDYCGVHVEYNPYFDQAYRALALD